jgi:DNA-binding MarR family transcriptional regulator
MVRAENEIGLLQKSTIEAVWTTLPPLWNRIKGHIHSLAESQYGISVEQFHILRHIRKGHTSVSELALVKQISRSAISQAVDGLVERGLVCRLQNEQDRRNIPLELTHAGSLLVEGLLESNRVWMAEKMAGLTEEEYKTVSQAMDILGKAFAE